jgi:hypothetical protein
MSQITVWKCDQTGKLFEDKVKYQSHLRKLARERNEKRKLAVIEAEANAWWNEAYNKEMTIQEWKQFVIANQNMFWAEAAKHDPYDWRHVGKMSGRRKNGVVCPVPELLEFTQFDVRWNPQVSNSHSCPHNGVTCWSSREAEDGRPRSYPGWSGRIEWIVKWPKEWDGFYLGSDLFSGGTFRTGRQRAHTGTGGGGGMRYSEKHKCHVQSFGYDFRIFAADWPGMARHMAKQQLVEVLQGKRDSVDWTEEVLV